ncbi:pimeloyl-ACP methyl ester carboxylesterase [Kitasatospora sp. GAS204A]|uniref:alpha/beta fold hydrolase n=1 Tax=unclassified Kitasatospora TaxID=2633591 RepID=UPI002476E006|nr:alpha/beta hydrolase [Kitasatospora sp. GAS204B]MDH6120201.1 pimeloyl-ACP methyl ester carboxylesterase [Kitasatospora sp. GAS204B]
MRRDGRVANFLLALLSRDWAGVPVALAVAGVGGGLVGFGSDWVVVLGGLLVTVGVVLLAGAVRHLVLVTRRAEAERPPGRLVDVGGHRIHVLAEGDAGGGLTVVWMPGGHAPGEEFGQLHAMLAASTRSVLVDRFGTAWSDVGPFPRTTAAEAEELLAALEGAGERPPYVLVGHSLGGLLVANAARRRPDLVAGVVLLDPTPLEVIAFAPPNPMVAGMRGALLLTALRHLFGIHRSRGRGSRTGQYCAAASIFTELSPAGLAGVGWETVVYDGDLGDLPLVLVIPRDLTGGETVLAAARDAAEAERIGRFYLGARTRYLAASTASRVVYTPAGTGHDFPTEAPGFVVGVVADLVRELRTFSP